MDMQVKNRRSKVDAKAANPLQALLGHGQSVWLDYIRRSLITSGELDRLIAQDGLRGVTSNPAIFEKAITGSSDYAEILARLAPEKLDPKSLYERIAVADIQDSADILKPLYTSSAKRDGYVSLEVSPYLARDTQGTLEEARRLWKAVHRPNVMIKVPATPEGIPAFETLIAEGINVNVTLLFAQSAYETVADAFLRGLERRAATGGSVAGIASVASFFISRIDSAIDAILERQMKAVGASGEQGALKSLMGRVAIANAKLTYQRYLDLFSGPRWEALAAKGAQTQRVLWASTSTKNASYRDTIYVEELIGADTVNTIPPATFDAFRDHGKLRASLIEDLEGAHDTMATLARVGISMKEVTDRLLDDGVKIFADAFDKLLAAVNTRCQSPVAAKLNRQTTHLPPRLAKAVQAALDDWQSKGKVQRLWARDAKIWSGADEAEWLGWLTITDDQVASIDHLKAVAADVKQAGFTDILLLGMGGSSLAPEVLKMTFGRVPGFPELHVLDSTDPQQVRRFESKVDLAKTLFIVSSKSGSTLEPNIFKQYFFERAKQVVGEAEAGRRFIAITDPGSRMQQVAEGDGFRSIFFGRASIGGRYSALSDFGMVPAAAMGLDVERFLDSTQNMVHACSPCVSVAENPGVVLGAVLGVAANAGRDKLTITASPGLHDLGAWLEQLVAESTGKIGKGIIPVDREALADPRAYGDDRVFVYVRLANAPDASQDAAIDALERAGHPVVRMDVADQYDLGQEIFRWELATAVAGSIIGINPFNQPDVEASKIATRKLTNEYEERGSLPEEAPFFEGDGIKLFADRANEQAILGAAGSDQSLVRMLRAHLERIRTNDYVAMLAYIEMNDANERALQSMRHAVRDARKVATCLGFGPRFLHSTGQGYKGGPNSGVFLQITCDDATDIAVPSQTFTFGVVKAAQARGDFNVLAERNRRALRVHLGTDVAAGMATLEAVVRSALL
ncbi:MAG: bifunctional transaldolase/phosoglucose isomerase [Burkholderiales bacterium]